jgi:phthalate 4,5-cis-dihydrodiol dehydrogenase
MSGGKLRLGVAGLGRGFMLMLPGLAADPRIELAAAADPRPEARARFVAAFGGRAYDTVEALCSDGAIAAVYVATPHEFHAEHVVAAASAGKHVLCEKPMALSLADCRRMVEAARRAGVHLLVGPSHSYDAPILAARRLIDSGAHGRVRMITALYHTDFLYRPRRPEELDPATGGGVVFSQAAHQVDIVRLLAGAPIRTIRAVTGDWDPARPSEGAYSAFVTFEGGAAATLTYSGYGRFDGDELCGWVGETGAPRDPDRYGAARRALAGADESALKRSRTWGAMPAAAPDGTAPPHHEHFGFVLASCERADLRSLPDGVMVYGETERHFHALPPPRIARQPVIDELCAAVIEGRAPLHSGEWGMATVAACLALRRSAAEGRDVVL